MHVVFAQQHAVEDFSEENLWIEWEARAWIITRISSTPWRSFITNADIEFSSISNAMPATFLTPLGTHRTVGATS
jgi:hypothetical protein